MSLVSFLVFFFSFHFFFCAKFLAIVWWFSCNFLSCFFLCANFLFLFWGIFLVFYFIFLLFFVIRCTGGIELLVSPVRCVHTEVGCSQLCGRYPCRQRVPRNPLGPFKKPRLHTHLQLAILLHTWGIRDGRWRPSKINKHPEDNLNSLQIYQIENV